MEALIDVNFASEINMRHNLNHNKPTSGFEQTLHKHENWYMLTPIDIETLKIFLKVVRF